MNKRIGLLTLVSLLVLATLAACGGNSSMDGMSGMNGTVMPMMNSTAMPMMNGTAMPMMNGTAMPMMNGTAMPMMDQGGMPMMNGTAMPMMDQGGMPMAMTEVQFIDGMIVHHQGAITMASEAVAQATRPEVKDLAQKIVAAQQPEITQLQTWRTAWYPNEPATDAAMLATMGMGDMAMEPDSTKPYDERFLIAMIAHHRGAVQMAEMIKGTATHAELTAFAEKVITDQTAEITTMETWLKEWGTK